jgi:glycosyltransferase involved in cell wall biosynthesis
MMQESGRRPRTPTLSVVVPNYNHGRYLKAALEAHLVQSTAPCEVIVVDDASTDDSRSIVEDVAARHPAVRLIRVERNGGVNAAINRGLREARGDFVCFSAADDLVSPDFAARSLAILAEHPTAGVCFSDPAEMVGDSGVVQPLPLRLRDRPSLIVPAELERLLKHSWFGFPGHAVLYRRDALLAVGGFDDELRWYADWFATCVLAFRHGACYVPEVLAVFRVSPGSYHARGLRVTAVQRALVFRILDLLQSADCRDVAPAFRRSALIPELRARVLVWLLSSPRHRGYLTPRLAVRLLVRGTWFWLRSRVPGWVRPAARRLSFGWSRLASGALRAGR